MKAVSCVLLAQFVYNPEVTSYIYIYNQSRPVAQQRLEAMQSEGITNYDAYNCQRRMFLLSVVCLIERIWYLQLTALQSNHNPNQITVD